MTPHEALQSLASRVGAAAIARGLGCSGTAVHHWRSGRTQIPWDVEVRLLAWAEMSPEELAAQGVERKRGGRKRR